MLRSPSFKPMRRRCAALLAFTASAAAHADPGYYLLVPYATPRELAVDIRYWSVDTPNNRAILWPEAGLRYGVNSRWTTELLASFIGPSLNDQRISSWNWQNDWLLTQGQYAFDFAVHTQLIHERGEGNVLELGAVWQTEIGSRTQLNINLVFERALSHADGTEAKVQWQVLHRLQPGLRAGIQGFSELGRLGHADDAASHRAGPVVKLGLGRQVDLQAAYLWGKVYGRKGEMFSAQLLYKF